MRIYADNAATTPMSETAIKAMEDCIRNHYGNPSAVYKAGLDAKKQLQTARRLMAECLHAEESEIIFTSGGSESDNQAILSAARYGRSIGKCHIVTTQFEHHAVLHTVKKLEREGFKVSYIKVNGNGIVLPRDVENAIEDDTCLVSVMYANNEIGTVQPIREIGEICRRRGVLFHSDAVQAVGHIPIDVKKDALDYLSLSAHKFHGPKGVGALYVNSRAPVFSMIEGGGQEQGRRAGTENVPGIAAMAAALSEACRNMPACSEKVSAMRDRLIEGILEIPGSRLNGDRSERLPGTVNFSFEGIKGGALLFLLDAAEGIAASGGSACNTGSVHPSHVLTALGLSEKLADSALRISLSGYNTMEEAEYIISAVARSVNKLRKK